MYNQKFLPHSTPKVSVIVPVYNTERYVERAVVSLMEQTLDNVQFIIIDDGSKDRSLSIINDVIARYPDRQEHVILISRENRGVAATRSQGMKLATGDYVIHLDSDDWAELNWLESMYNKAIAESADVVVCDYVAVYVNKLEHIHMPAEQTGYTCLKQLLCDKQRGYTWNKLISRDIIMKIEHPFIDGINYLEDFIYVMKCFHISNKIIHVEQYLYNYNQQNTNSITKGMSSSKRKDILSTVNYVSEFLTSATDSDFYAHDLMVFKIKQKVFLIYGEWKSVSMQTWQLFPDANPYVLSAEIPPHFKLCMMMANFKLYGLASIFMLFIVKMKFMLMPSSHR
ncbi:glycosyltransferase family 2 protein [Aeromonas caviae]|uniref:glycosyltransferase family 2 protein n=1 Tax=Aeromonas sp. QDB37 TaxID=2989829 RepID=UPI0022E435E3|nr:glycosyltransferase family 2 protein [Aeromonas sp. QDB37]